MEWSSYRDLFPVTRRWAFFDHAAVAPLSLPAQEAMTEWARDLADNGVVSDAKWQQRLASVRRLAASLLNADPQDIAFIKNTSEGIGIVAEGMRWQPGDNVVTAQEEYPANLYPWLNLAERGVEVRTVPSRGNRLAIDDIRAASDARTRIITLSFVEYASGFRNDLAKLGELCRERGSYFFVDAIQGLGVLPLDVRNTPIDFLAADGHKWLLGPEGAGILYVRRELVDELHAVGVGWNSVVQARDFNHIELRLKPNAGRWESGTLNMAGISALGASIELLLRIGIDNIADRVLQLTDYLCERANLLDVPVFSSRVAAERSGIVSLCPAGDVRALVRRSREAGFVVNHRAGRLRVSPHFYNTTEEIDRLLNCLTGAPLSADG